MNSLFPDICSSHLKESREFYQSLLGLEPAYEIDWYVQLQSPVDKNLQIAFVAKDHPSVPKGFGMEPQGVIITVETDEVGPVYQRAKELGLPIVQDLRDEEWGQRHFMARDPNGLLVDLVQMIEPSAEFLQQYADE